MEGLLIIAVLIAFACWSYKAGKRTGSRKGHNVGRSRGPRR